MDGCEIVLKMKERHIPQRDQRARMQRRFVDYENENDILAQTGTGRVICAFLEAADTQSREEIRTGLILFAVSF